jgi:hypothetical protein
MTDVIAVDALGLAAKAVAAATPGGSSLQIQFNNSGAFGGMAGTSWDATNQQLTMVGKTFTSGSPGPGATLSLNKTYNQSVLDLKSDVSGNILRVYPGGGWPAAPTSPRLYINNGGGFYSQAWMVISGSYTGSGDGLAINPPSADATMLSLWADVQTAWQSRVWNAASGRHWTALDRSGNYVLSVEEYGNICWAGSASTYVMDTSLSRIAAAGLAVGNGTAGDFTGSLKLTTLKFPDGTSQTTAFAGITIASGKSLTVSNILTLAGTDSTTMTFPSSSATIPGIGLAQTWTGLQTYNAGITFPNNVGINGTLAAGGNVVLFNLDGVNALNIGIGTIGHTQMAIGSGKELRVLNNNAANRVLTAGESTSQVIIGNSSAYDGTLTVFQGTATTGDTSLAIRDGAARAARLKFAPNSGSYDVGLARDSAGVLAVVDGSTTLSNYRDFKARSIQSTDGITLAGQLKFTPLTIAQLLALSPSKGWVQYVSDTVASAARATGVIIAGGGSTTVNGLASFDGTNWAW